MGQLHSKGGGQSEDGKSSKAGVVAGQAELSSNPARREAEASSRPAWTRWRVVLNKGAGDAVQWYSAWLVKDLGVTPSICMGKNNPKTKHKEEHLQYY